ncbi:MAG: hypothetical protein IKQ29_01195 [Bacilli bacterium]|nr:hypothetical protein [Bacilli bacterium]
MNSNVLFKKGDHVLINKTGEDGIVKEVISVLGRGDNTYLVNVNNKSRMYTEDNLSLIREKLCVDEVNANDIGFLIEIEDKIDDIIKELKLVKSDNAEICLANAVKVQAYLVSMKEEKNAKAPVTSNVILEDLYNGFINNKADYVTYSYMFSEILKRLGMKVLNVGAKDENGDFYVTNLVLIGDKYYYFDTNLDKEILDSEDDDELVLCCAGIGYERYTQYFTPLSILNYNNTGMDVELPSNISKTDFDIDYVNSLRDL